MSIWLCPVKPKSWHIIKQKNLFGVPASGRQKLNAVKVGNLLAFYIFKPTDGIVAIYRIDSNPFEDNEDVWGKGRYPYRIRIKPVPEFAGKRDKPISLYLVFGTFDNEKGIIVEPYLRGVSLMELDDKQFQRLNFLNHNKKYEKNQYAIT